MHQVFLSLGSNMGRRRANLDKAMRLLHSESVRIKKVSSVYETEPWGCSLENNFYNQAVEIETSFGPGELLDKCHETERLCGRKPSIERYAPRIIDIDILFYENWMLSTESLKIPHPLLHKRLFVLVPLAEIAPDYLHPVFAMTIRQLLTVCEDEKNVLKIL